MRLTLYTDFSLRVLIYLGAKDQNELSTIQEISDKYRISKNHLTKVVHELGKMGLIETVRGRGGGIRMKLRPEEINVGQLVRKTEDDFYLVECFSADGNRCILSPVCRLKGALQEALLAYFAVLDKYTIADFIVNKDELAAILFGKPL
ncbi:RrF2 family transcriptional regulator [Sporosarcina highlanderae]|uniref:HTH-type transcriptional regulator NsrR n=1 Tax=Sporosarcina highlanderae TaxID=3035916 RepID=A0ABT8JMJ5_9BACL|nr:Rrf2 family transcriptional regulator [Sporosarcina highlanderae]MDN4606383.1 Rrf2 family transcriptional regulator [Sporosarcina highlanderae]